jgi:uncharacterized protein (DUF302 family)
LTGQPRAVVFHVKDGREHCHVVWSRIDVDNMRAIHLSHDHSRLMDMACKLARKYGFDLPDGLKKWEAKQKFEKDYLEAMRAENAQLEETGITPEERRAEVTAAYNQSDSAEAFRAALEQKGYIIAKGDRRDLVIVDEFEGVHSLSRYIKGQKSKDKKAKLAPLMAGALPKPRSWHASAPNLFAFGSLWSSAEDISVWDIALAGSVLVKREENRALIYKPTRLGNGTTVPAMVGWEFTRHPGFMEMKGSSPGFSAYLSRFTAPGDLVCVTLLANREGLDLTGLARDIAESYKADLGAGASSDGVVTQESKFSVDETASRLESLLKAQSVPVFAVFDHGENARQAGMELRPTKVIVFGNPKVGTKLMQGDQAIALDLPLRVSIREDERHRVWVSYRAMDRLAADHGVKDDATVLAMERVLEKLVGRAANVYDY